MLRIDFQGYRLLCRAGRHAGEQEDHEQLYSRMWKMKECSGWVYAGVIVEHGNCLVYGCWRYVR